MKKLWLIGSLVLVMSAVRPAQAQWGWPPPGYRPPLVTLPDGTVVPSTGRYGLCAAWKRKYGSTTSGPAGADSPCPTSSIWDRLRARCGLSCLSP